MKQHTTQGKAPAAETAGGLDAGVHRYTWQLAGWHVGCVHPLRAAEAEGADLMFIYSSQAHQSKQKPLQCVDARTHKRSQHPHATPNQATRQTSDKQTHAQSSRLEGGKQIIQASLARYDR